MNHEHKQQYKQPIKIKDNDFDLILNMDNKNGCGLSQIFSADKEGGESVFWSQLLVSKFLWG